MMDKEKKRRQPNRSNFYTSTSLAVLRDEGSKGKAECEGDTLSVKHQSRCYLNQNTRIICLEKKYKKNMYQRQVETTEKDKFPFKSMLLQTNPPGKYLNYSSTKKFLIF